MRSFVPRLSINLPLTLDPPLAPYQTIYRLYISDTIFLIGEEDDTLPAFL